MSQKTKIKITRPIPLDKRHGIKQGDVLEVVEFVGSSMRGRPGGSCYVMGATGERCRIWSYEYEIVEQPLKE